MTRSLALFLLGTVALTSTSAFSISSSSSDSNTRSLASSPLHVSAMPTVPGPSSSSHDDEEDGHHAETVKLPPGVHAPVTVINSPQELAAFLEQDDRLCVIKFHAAWCKSCQRFGRKFQGLANQKTDWVADSDGSVLETGSMRFGSIEFGANTGICRSLNIKRLPTVHIYQGGQQLDGFPCGPSKFPRLLEAVDHYLNKQSQQDAFAATLQEGANLMSHGEVAEKLQDLMEQEANGTLDSKAVKEQKNKKWWSRSP